LYHHVMDQGEIQEIEEVHYPPLDSWYRVVLNPSERGLSVYFHDITESRRAREVLREREVELSRQAALLDEATDAILVRDLDHRVVFWNRSAERIYGWTADEAVGADIRELINDNGIRFQRAHAHLLERGEWTGELQLRRRDGSYVIVDARWTLLRDDDGGPSAVLAIHTDVTERRRMELHLARAQRLESLGTLAGGVAHDLNNVLSPILLAAEHLWASETEADRAGLLDLIVDGARRGGSMVAQVLAFARGVDGTHADVDVEELVGGVAAIIRETFPKNITLRIHRDRPPGAVSGDRTQLQQVLLNLAVNARDAMPDGGTLTISMSAEELDEQYLAGVEGAAPGGHLVIEVADDGHGMTPDVLDRVFEPFFTTKEHGAGTGIGLSTAAGILRSHDGFIRAYSEPGVGSRVRVYVPASDPHDDPSGDDRGSAAETTVAAPLVAAAVDGVTVLLVDDETAIRTMTRRTLEAAGYVVVEAADGAQAVSLAARSDQPIDLAIVDMMMPVMDGPATVHALWALSPTMRIVAASGLRDGRVDQMLAIGVRQFLAKPFTVRQLLDTVGDALRDDAPYG
ncbi:MAG: ATP-binding protein, partial [Acidimicrobiia bacterium]